MANNVFANGRELSCKSGSGKSIACLPDVCMTPPENPATPPGVPVPYPNTGSTSDATSGSTTVKISKKEASLKNKSYFKKSMGDEAGSAAKKGVVSSKNRGKVYFTAWSMDVKIEGENAVRHLDMTTHNHGSPTNTGPWMFIDSVSLALSDPTHPCHEEVKEERKACKDLYDDDGEFQRDKFEALCESKGLDSTVPGRRMQKFTSDASVAPTTLTSSQKAAAKANPNDTGFFDKKAAHDKSDAAQADDCLKARRCGLVPGNLHPTAEQKNEGNACCDGQTPHHVVDGAFCRGIGSYDYSKAPAVCSMGGSTSGTHGFLHAHMKKFLMENCTNYGASSKMTYSKVRDQGVKGVRDVFPTSGCSEKCLKAQIDQYHKGAGIQGNKQINVGKANKTGRGLQKGRVDSVNDFIQSKKS